MLPSIGPLSPVRRESCLQTTLGPGEPRMTATVDVCLLGATSWFSEEAGLVPESWLQGSTSTCL